MLISNNVENDTRSLLETKRKTPTYIIICQKHLCQQIMHESTAGETYQTTNKTEDEIAAEDYRFVKKEGPASMDYREAQQLTGNSHPPEHTWFYPTIPTFGVSLKIHEKNQLRYMEKSHDTSLTQLSQWMSRAFRETMLISENIWRDSL